MTGPYRLIVTDASPLFKLVLADSLDVLLRPGLPVSIPDAVYVEARGFRVKADVFRLKSRNNSLVLGHLARRRRQPSPPRALSWPPASAGPLGTKVQ